MNINEYADEYEIYQNSITLENAENYLKEKENYEQEIENLKEIIEEVRNIVYGDKSYGNSEDRIKDIKEVVIDD